MRARMISRCLPPLVRVAVIAVALLPGCDQSADPYQSCQQAVEDRCRARDDRAAKRLAQLREIDQQPLEEQVEFYALDKYDEEVSCSTASKAETILKCVERRFQ